MEPSQELISSRREKIQNQITGKSTPSPNLELIHRESLLDALQVLYDECSLETLQKQDRHISNFVSTYKRTMLEMKKLRVNTTDFEIRAVIGRGHFGEVHLVKEKQTGDIYAMKTIRKCDSLGKTAFNIERDIMAKAQSPWLTSLQYAFQDPNCLFFVMEYHPGGDLLGLLYRQGGTLPESAATFYLAEALAALEYLHGMGYVHRDIKPDNLLLDRCGHLKLVDFGSAALLNKEGSVINAGPPVGTPDYIAPEVLRSLENKNGHYGIACDYWSVGILAYELTVGKPPFCGEDNTATYAKIMNHHKNLKFPQDVLLTQAFVHLIKNLLVDQKSRLTPKQVRAHALFRHFDFESLRYRVPPYVPKILSLEDTSNFSDVEPKKAEPNIDNFKKRTQFSGRNLPFVGFTFTHDLDLDSVRSDRRFGKGKDDVIKSLRAELEDLRRNRIESEDLGEVKLGLERKLMERTQKLENVENVRNRLEKDLASNIAECTALKRTLEIERKDRAELEKKALDLIKSAKTKWETSERTKVDALNLEIEQQQNKIAQLSATNNMLNEQLQRAFKMEETHRESMEVVEKLNRRSVVGLESRLDKITQETQITMADLQEKLQYSNNEKMTLISKLEKSKHKHTLMAEKLKGSEDSYRNLKEKVDEAELVINHLSNKVNELESEMENSDLIRKQVQNLKEQLDKNQIQFRDLELKNSLLSQENTSLNHLKSDYDQLKVIISQNESKIAQLETKLMQELSTNETLRKQLDEQSSPNHTEESQQLKEIRMKLWRNEKELNNSKIDKRIVERELREAEKQIKQLQEESELIKKNSSESKSNNERALLELNNINEMLSVELMRLKETCSGLESKLQIAQERNSDEKSVIIELKSLINSKEDTIVKLRKDFEVIQGDKDSINRKNSSFQAEKQTLLDEISSLKKLKCQLENKLECSAQQMKNTELNLGALRETCSILDAQLSEFEKMIASMESEKRSLHENTEQLIRDLCVAKEDIQKAKQLANEEKSLRLMTEIQVKRLNEDIQCLQNECTSYKSQSLKYKECSNGLSDELTLAEEKISDLEVSLRSYERQMEDFISESISLKEEISQYLTQLSGVKESNFKLKEQIHELNDTKKMHLQKIEELERTLGAKIGYYEEREVKSRATIQQQTKLIDYLQIKIDEQTHKKRTLTDKIFGSRKENQPPLILPLNYKDLEGELRQQKEQNRTLREEVFRLKASTGLKINENILKQTSKLERSKSEKVAPKKNNQPPTPTPTSPQETAIVEGWIKVLGANKTWDKRWGMFTNTHINVCTGPPQEGGLVLRAMALEGDHEGMKVALEPLPSEIGVAVADNDLPFIFKVEEIYNKDEVMIFMALSIEDRDKWYQALNQKFTKEVPQIETVIPLPADLHINCVLDLSKTIQILGTESGLFAHYNNSLLPIEGPSPIKHLVGIPSIRMVLMIVGPQNSLISCDLGHLLNLSQCSVLTKPKLSYQKVQINDLEQFVFLEGSALPTQPLFCAANATQLAIAGYNVEESVFVPLRVMDTAEPISCVLFTEHSLIVGADKFFEIDLADFNAEEFLDASDIQLKPAIKCHRVRSFPLAIAQVTHNPKEYLICFKEMAVFVDEYGRSSRNTDLISDQVPLSYHYVKPYLYVVHFNGVKVVKITEELCRLEGVCVATLEVGKLRFLGRSPIGVYFEHDGAIKAVEGRKVLDLDDSSSDLVSEQRSEDRFSFTSSIMQSLDGNLSDCESDGGRVKRVQFSQTSL